MADEFYDNASRYRDSLFYIITETGVSLESVADNWINSYKNNKSEALISLLQFFIDSSGCKGEIREIPEDFTDIIRELTLNFNEKTRGYPLIEGGRKFKTFKTNFCEFVFCLFKACQNSILYDDYLMPKLSELLTSLSDSQVRAFRHTSTLAVVKIMTTLVDVFNNLSKKRKKALSQHKIEASKPPEFRSQHCQEFAHELEENLIYVEDILKYFFKTVFVIRYRDRVPEIRVICIGELGKWLVNLPELFFTDSRIKYLAWSLNDREFEVRKCTLSCLRNIFDTYDLWAKMEFFLLSCKERIVSMTFDIEPSVAVEAVHLIYGINQKVPDFFSQKEIEGVYHLVFGMNSEVARAAGSVLNKTLPKVLNSYSLHPVRGSKITSTDIIIKEIVRFFLESEIHDHTAYLVDSLFDFCSALKDWESMAGLLLSENSGLSNDEEKVIIDLLTCSVKQSSTGTPPIGREKVKNTKYLKDIRMVTSDKGRLTCQLIPVLPQLLNKFRSNHRDLLNLLQIPLYFDLDLFLIPNQPEHAISLLNILQIIFEKSDDLEVLQACAKLFGTFCNDKYSLASVCKTHVYTIAEITVQKLNSSLGQWKFSEGNIDPDTKFMLTNSIKKISALYSLIDLNEYGLWKVLFETLEQNASHQALDFSDDIIKYSLVSCYYNVLWNLNGVEEQIEAGSSSDELIMEFRNTFTNFMKLVEYMIKESQDSCAEEAFKIFCDILLIFGAKNDNKFFKILVGFISLPSSRIRDLLYGFLQKNVFCDHDSASVEDMYNKRILISSYCKLFTYNVLPVYFMSDLFIHYISTYSAFGDILDVTILSVKEAEKVDCSRAIVNSLITIFEAMKEVSENNSVTDFLLLKKISKKLSFSLGLEKTDDIFIKTIHSDGILFALRGVNDDGTVDANSSNLQFFEILVDFSSKLSQNNKTYIFNYLKDLPLTEKISGEKYYLNYLKSLTSN